MKRKKRSQKKRTGNRPRAVEQRALLESRAARIWLRRLNGATGFLRELSALPVSQKDTWAIGNWEHYKKQVEVLLGQGPKGAEKYIARIRREVEKLKL